MYLQNLLPWSGLAVFLLASTSPSQSPKPKDPYPISDQCQGDANKDGKLSYFEAHPEWFAFEGGQRVPGIGWTGTNFCTSNPHAATEFFKNYLEALIDGPYREADRWPP